MHGTLHSQPPSACKPRAGALAASMPMAIPVAWLCLTAISDRLRLEVEAAGAALIRPGSEAQRGPEKKQGGRVLIVDDDSDMRTYVRRCLSGAAPPFGEIIEAADGIAALHMLETTNVDLIITDVVMPGMDGISFHARLRADERYMHIAVLFVSAMLHEADLRRRLAPGPNLGILPKPFSARTLLEAVGRLR